MINTILLIILVLFCAFYVTKALKPETKKDYLKKRLHGKTRELWDFEFQVDKTLEIREGVRQDRDKLVDARYNVEAALKAKPKDEKLLKDFEELTNTIKRYEAQMKMLDTEIQGVKPEGDNPGQNGINDSIASVAEVKNMYKQYIKKL